MNKPVKDVLKYIIIGFIIIAISILLIYHSKKLRTGGDMLKIYDKYGEVSCEFFYKNSPDGYKGIIYAKDGKLLRKGNLSDEIMYIDGNDFYGWGGNFYEYFGGYKGCTFSIREDTLGNKIYAERVLSNIFSGEFSSGLNLNCKNKVYDAFDFELPEYCDFENEFSLSGWKEYKFKNLFSFKYPDGLIIENQKFIYDLYNKYDSNSPNIYAYVYDFDDFMRPILSEQYHDTSDFFLNANNNEKKEHYKSILENIANGNGVKTIQSPDFFDHISRYETVGPIAAHQINVDGINGLLINYYLTDDKSKGCITQFVTELLLVKNYNEIISIIFKNNFGEVENMLNNKMNTYDFRQTQDGQFCSQEVFRYIKNLEEFYKDGSHPTFVTEFQINYEIIKEIIRTIKINN